MSTTEQEEENEYLGERPKSVDFDLPTHKRGEDYSLPELNEIDFRVKRQRRDLYFGEKIPKLTGKGIYA
jgi:hypothetical protein